MAVFNHNPLARGVEEAGVLGHVLLIAATIELDGLEAKVQRCLDVASKAGVRVGALGARLLAFAIVPVPSRNLMGEEGGSWRGGGGGGGGGTEQCASCIAAMSVSNEHLSTSVSNTSPRDSRCPAAWPLPSSRACRGRAKCRRSGSPTRCESPRCWDRCRTFASSRPCGRGRGVG